MKQAGVSENDIQGFQSIVHLKWPKVPTSEAGRAPLVVLFFARFAL